MVKVWYNELGKSFGMSKFHNTDEGVVMGLGTPYPKQGKFTTPTVSQSIVEWSVN